MATAIALNRKGIASEIFEASKELKAAGAGLVLAANAMKAFENIGIADEIERAGNVIKVLSIYDDKGALLSRTDTEAVSKKMGIANLTIHRGALQKILLNQIVPATLHLDKRAVECEIDGNGAIINFSDGSTVRSDLVIVADGIHSPIRKQLWPGSEPVYAGYTCWRAVIKSDDLHIFECSQTWGRKGRFGIAPLGRQ